MALAIGSNRQRSPGKLPAAQSRLRALPLLGQSVWLDYIRRSLITSGELHRLIEDDGLLGVTSNPAIFEKAIVASSDYEDLLDAPAARGLAPGELYERLAVRDIQEAADVLRPVYDATAKRDGYVSLEVSPLLAYDTAATLAEANRLWQAVGRDNLMIKVPATAEGIAAARELVANGLNVNVTLLFSPQVYQQVAAAYMEGLEKLVANGGNPAGVASVASFFVSRIDTAVDALLEERLQGTSPARAQSALRGLRGKAAIANASVAYQRYRELFGSRRWQALAACGAQTQRLLWASTGAKNPSYGDVRYVEELVAPDTVNTMPPSTLEAFRDHGRTRISLVEDVDDALDTMRQLAEAGIDMRSVTEQLLHDGVRLFTDSFGKLLHAVEERSRRRAGHGIDGLACRLPDALGAAVQRSLDEWQAAGKMRRLWSHDSSLWTGRDEGHWLGWLHITDDQLAHADRFARVTEAAKSGAFASVLLLGMGGSSLGPEVLRQSFGRVSGFPEMHVLDSTVPAEIKAFEENIDLAKTLFIVSSKSGSTLEPNILKEYFFARACELSDAEEAGRRFVAITDPNSSMQRVAERDGFRHVFFGWSNIGGRYSVLSDFGLVPAAVMGIDVGKLLDRANEMVCACMLSVPVHENPGAVLGTILGVAAEQFGRDKLTLIASPGIRALGAWLEQLVAESTGKQGRGLIPVQLEALGDSASYGEDRLFVYVRLLSAPDPAQEAAVDALAAAGHPVVRIAVRDAYDLGGEFFRWEIATAVAGSILGIHPFDQPDVEASKIATRTLTADYERSRRLPKETPIWTGDGVELYTDDKNAGALTASLAAGELTAYLRAHLGRLAPGDYFALLAYLEMSERNERVLQAIRERVRIAKGVATCVEFGPRFLHSTGQAYKGGPNTGVFLQITSDDLVDLPVPGRNYTFGVVKWAQARGDFEVLLGRARRALRVHLGADVPAGLDKLERSVAAALES
ncbi:MAG TPA: bifunctional transaldolase/phosoglucose isomerase [Gammaproteobacteria bacterium]|nr:bifunctional transaldolase/phosoglucose isomerase [Gammaproteobacteria bacterium]